MFHHLVGAILIRSDRVLLGQRSADREFYPNVWDIFGGHIEPEEVPEQALIREVQEELGVTPTQWVEMEIVRQAIPGHELLMYVYRVTDWEGEPVNRQLEEHAAIEWFSYEDAVQLELADASYPRLLRACLDAG